MSIDNRFGVLARLLLVVSSNLLLTACGSSVQSPSSQQEVKQVNYTHDHVTGFGGNGGQGGQGGYGGGGH